MEVNKDVEKINNSIKILDLIKEFNIDIEKRGKNYFALCPFHEEKTPSFSISVDKNIAICMGCHKGGQPFNFYKEIKKLTFIQTLSELGKRIGLEIKTLGKNTKYQKHYDTLNACIDLYKYILLNTDKGKKFLDYLQNQRGLSLKTIEKFQIGASIDSKDFLSKTLLENGYEKDILLNTKMSKIGYNNDLIDTFSNRIMFPIFDIYKNPIAFSGRLIEKDENNPKYFNSPESVLFQKAQTIYNLDNALIDNSEKEVILVEGFFDVIALDNIGIYNLIATMGTAFSDSHIKILEKKINTITLLFDGDNAGYLATLKAIEKLKKSSLNVNVCIIKEGLDPDEFIKKYGKEEFLKILENKKDMYTFLYEKYLEKYNLENNNELLEFIKNIEKDFSYANIIIKNKYKNIIKEKYGYDLNFNNINENKNFYDNTNNYNYDDFSNLDQYEFTDAEINKLPTSLEPIYDNFLNNNDLQNYKYDSLKNELGFENDNIKTYKQTDTKKTQKTTLINGNILKSFKYDNSLETILLHIIELNSFKKQEILDILNLDTIKYITLDQNYLNLLNSIKFYMSYNESFILNDFENHLKLDEKLTIIETLNKLKEKEKTILKIPSKKDKQNAINSCILCLKEYEKQIEKTIPIDILKNEKQLEKYLNKLTKIDIEKTK